MPVNPHRKVRRTPYRVPTKPKPVPPVPETGIELTLLRALEAAEPTIPDHFPNTQRLVRAALARASSGRTGAARRAG